MLAVPPAALLLGSRVSVGPASLLAQEHHLWSPVPEFSEAGGRETADSPQDALIAQGVGIYGRMGSAWFWPSPAHNVTPGYLPLLCALVSSFGKWGDEYLIQDD